MSPPLAVADVVVIPLKDFARAKSRLRPDRGHEGAADIARRLAAGVIAASAPRRCVVVCDDSSVASFATDHGAEVLVTEESTLNGAVSDAYRRLGSRATRVIVAHGDLLDPAGLGSEPFVEGVTLVVDHRGRGTNVLVLPGGLDFHFAYGPESAQRHLGEARRLGVSVRVVTDSPWRFDVDDPRDLEERPDST